MTILFPVLSAVLGILAFLPHNLWFFGFIFLVPLFIFLIKEKRFWRLVLGAFIFRFIFGLGTAYYTLEPIFWFSSIGIFLGLPVAIYLLKRALKRFSSSLISHLLSLIPLPFLWTFFDHLEARFSLLPTYIVTAGNIFGSSPFLGLSAIGGLIFLTFFASTINILITAVILDFQKSGFRKIAVIVIVIALITGWQISNHQLQKNAADYNELKNSLKIAVISTDENFNWLSFNKIKEELKNKKIDLVVFPEDIFNNVINSEKVYQNLAKELDVNLTATFNIMKDNKKYNSSALFNNKGEFIDARAKNRLTFAGEYWPFGEWRPFFFDWLAKNKPEIKNYAVFDPQSQYSRGEKKLLTLFASPICSEIQYQNDLKEYKKMGAKFIINPASNRWIEIGTKHFLYLNNNLRKIEAVWLKLPIISSGVKDFAGVILPDGKTEFADNGIFFGEIKY